MESEENKKETFQDKYWKKIKIVYIDGEKLYMRKGLFGWTVISPIFDEETRKFNWKNFIIGGSWIKFGLTILLFVLIVGVIVEYSNAVRVANECLANNPLSNIIFNP